MTLRLRQASYRYPTGEGPAVWPLELEIPAGQLALLGGPTGCGKSTLLRLAAGLAGRQGVRGGAVEVAGRELHGVPPSERVRLVGFVAQEPADQIVSGTLGDEVAFAMESAGLSAEKIEARIPELLHQVRLALPPEHPTRALSGGQTQRLVVAAALAAGAAALLLDEPLAWLDPTGARELMQTLREVADAGVAVLLVEHRLEICLPRVDRLLLMDGGRLVADCPAADFQPGRPVFRQARGLGLSLPGLADLEDRVAPRALSGLRFRDPAPATAPAGPPILTVTCGDYRWPGQARPALSALELQVRPGERLALLGANGAGKSTLLGLIAEDLPGARVRCAGRRVAVPQDPDLALFCATVREELAFGPLEQGLPGVAERVEAAAEALAVRTLLDRPPQALSRGQRLRVAVAAALSCDPAVLTLDEPTAGQDHDQVERMMGALSGQLAGGALLFATHDLDLALRHATRVIVLDEGRVVADGAPESVLGALDGLPSLARYCLSQGVVPGTAAELAARVC